MSFFDYLEVEEQSGDERRTTAHTVVDSHGVDVSFGDFTLASVEDLGIKIHGYEKLEEQLKPEVDKIRLLVKPGVAYNNQMHAEERKYRDSIPKRAVAKLRSLIIKVALEFFAKHPDHFEKWLQEQLDKKHQEGRELQANKICEALNVGKFMDFIGGD